MTKGLDPIQLIRIKGWMPAWACRKPPRRWLAKSTRMLFRINA